MKILIFFLLATTAWAGGPEKSREIDTSKAYVPGEVLVIVETGAVGIQGTVLNKYSISPTKQVFRVKLPKGKTVKETIAENPTMTIEPNWIVHGQKTPNDPQYAEQWALKDILAPQMWDQITGSDIIIAVIDSGIDSHPDLAENIWVNAGEIPDNGIDDDNNGYIDDVNGYDFFEKDNIPNDGADHGTHVAGTIAAVGDNGLGVAGVTWKAKLMNCRFLGDTNGGTIADGIEAVNYAVANGAKILNNSWGGGGYSEALKLAIENARDNGVLFVAAAGNGHADNDRGIFYPATYDVDNIIAVAAIDVNNNLASYSNYGDESVHIAAPGVDILSTVTGGVYGRKGGTSMATPHVSGVAALIWSQTPGYRMDEVKRLLLNTVESFDNVIYGKLSNPLECVKCNPKLTVISPGDNFRAHVGREQQIKVDIADCQNAVVDAQVTANDMELVGNAGVYTGSWTPTEAGPMQFDITATGGCAALQKSVVGEVFPYGPFIFDQGPLTGGNGGCWINRLASQHFMDQFSFSEQTTVGEINLFTCKAPVAGDVHVRISTDLRAAPVYSEDITPYRWVEAENGGGFMLSVKLQTPFAAQADTGYWVGVFGNDGDDIGLYTIHTPGDGTVAFFRTTPEGEEQLLGSHYAMGDMMFQLVEGSSVNPCTTHVINDTVNKVVVDVKICPQL